jgi:hypothetical protein
MGADLWCGELLLLPSFAAFWPSSWMAQTSLVFYRRFCPLVHPDCHFILQDCPLVHWCCADVFDFVCLHCVARLPLGGLRSSFWELVWRKLGITGHRSRELVAYSSTQGCKPLGVVWGNCSWLMWSVHIDCIACDVAWLVFAICSWRRELAMGFSGLTDDLLSGSAWKILC